MKKMIIVTIIVIILYYLNISLMFRNFNIYLWNGIQKALFIIMPILALILYQIMEIWKEIK